MYVRDIYLFINFLQTLSKKHGLSYFDKIIIYRPEDSTLNNSSLVRRWRKTFTILCLLPVCLRRNYDTCIPQWSRVGSYFQFFIFTGERIYLYNKNHLNVWKRTSSECIKFRYLMILFCFLYCQDKVCIRKEKKIDTYTK